ncbi:MAG: hypothetical protein ACK4IX_00490, partial [Candidatus Sericytochromatia bacterium]
MIFLINIFIAIYYAKYISSLDYFKCTLEGSVNVDSYTISDLIISRTFNELIDYISKNYIYFYTLVYLLVIPIILKINSNKNSKFFINILISINTSIVLLSFVFIGNESGGRARSVKVNMYTLQTILETYAVDWGGLYPQNLNELKKEAIKKEY